MKKLCGLLLLFFSSLSAEIEDYFKKAENKTSGHSLPGIDFIYMINLDQRPEKFKMSADQLAPFGIHPYRFSAVNGWELSLEAINEIGVKFSKEMEGGFMATSYHLHQNGKPSHENICNFGQTYFVHCMPRGAIGCAMSHLSVLQDAWDAGYETVWVLEDDIEVVRDPRILSDLILQLDQLVGEKGWDVLFTDRDFKDAYGRYTPAHGAAKRPDYAYYLYAADYSKKTNISPEFRRIAARYGTHSMIVRRSGMRKILQFFKAHQIYLPYDMDLVYPGLKMFALLHDVVSNLPKGISDVGGPFYLDKNK